MNLGSFPFLTIIFYLALVVLAPAVSLVQLKKHRDSTGDISSGKSLTSVFIAEVLIWLVVSSAVGYVLALMMGLFIFVNAHAGAQGLDSVPLAPLIVVIIIAGGMAVFGVALHDRSRKKLVRLV